MGKGKKPVVKEKNVKEVGQNVVNKAKIVEAVVNERLVNNETETILSVGKSSDTTSISIDDGYKSTINELITKIGKDDILKLIASSGASETVLKDQEDFVNKVRSAVPNDLKKILPSKEIQIDASRYIPIDTYERDLKLIREISQSVTRDSYSLERETVKIKKIKLPSTNLRIISSQLYKKAVIIESLPIIELVQNVDLSVQRSLVAIEMIKKYGLDGPCVLDISGNFTTDMYSAIKYSKDGLDINELIQVRSAVAKANNDLALTPTAIREIREQAVLMDTIGGATITQCYDGQIQSRIINLALDIWREDMMPLTSYIRHLRDRLPEGLRIKEYSNIELESGIVYHRNNPQNLQVLIDLEGNNVSEYFLRIYLNFLTNVPIDVASAGTVGAQLGADLQLTQTRANHANAMISAINVGGVKRVLSIYLLSCMTSNLMVEIDFNTSPTIVDMMAAALAILFIGRHALSHNCYVTCLKVMLTFLTNTHFHAYSNITAEDLIGRLNRIGWYITDLVNSESRTVSSAPILSDRVVGEYYVPFNMALDTSASLHVNLLQTIEGISSTRFRASSNNGLGSLISLTLNRVIGSVSSHLQGYTTVILAMRGSIPNILAPTLRLRGSIYNLSAVDWMSFMFTLGAAIPNDTFGDEVQGFASSQLLQFNTLSEDISKCAALIRSLIATPRYNASPFRFTSAIDAMIKEVWKGQESMVSNVMTALLSVTSGDGKAGYNRFMQRLATYNYEEITDPNARLINEVAEIIRINAPSFGIADEILIYPPGFPALGIDAELDEIFVDSPFLSAMPLGVQRIDYRCLINSDNSADLIANGVIIYGVPFRFSYTINPNASQTRLVDDIIHLDSTGLQSIGVIKWELAFKETRSKSESYYRLFSRQYRVAIMRPNNIFPLSAYRRFMVDYRSADTNEVYVDKHTFVYSRI